MEVSFLADHLNESEKIAKWYLDEWGYTVPNITFDMVHKKILEKSKSKVELPLMFVIHDEQELVGVAELKFRENKNFPKYEHWIGGIYVSSEHRGKGYSTILIEKAKSHALEQGINLLYLQCEDKNINLYLKQNFKALHQTEHNSVKTTIMVHQININRI